MCPPTITINSVGGMASNQMAIAKASFIGAKIGEIYSEYLTDEEVTRAKYKNYSELLSVQAASDQM